MKKIIILTLILIGFTACKEETFDPAPQVLLLGSWEIVGQSVNGDPHLTWDPNQNAGDYFYIASDMTYAYYSAELEDYAWIEEYWTPSDSIYLVMPVQNADGDEWFEPFGYKIISQSVDKMSWQRLGPNGDVHLTRLQRYDPEALYTE